MDTETLKKYKTTFTDLPPELHKLVQQVENKCDNKIIGNIRGIFNKINNTNYKDMTNTILKNKLTNQNQLSKLVNILLHKIIFEKHNHDVYMYITQILMRLYIIDNNKKIYFRSIFLEKSQKLFHESITFTQPDNSMITDKKASVNFIRFQGLLYDNKLLSDKIINSCLSDIFFNINIGNHELIDALSAFIDIVKYKLGDISGDIIVQLKKVNNIYGLEKRLQFKLNDTIDSLEGN